MVSSISGIKLIQALIQRGKLPVRNPPKSAAVIKLNETNPINPENKKQVIIDPIKNIFKVNKIECEYSKMYVANKAPNKLENKYANPFHPISISE